MSLSSNALTTADRLSGFLGITTPTGVTLTAIDALINAVSEFILRYTSRTFTKTVHTQLVLSTERGQILNLPYYPVISTEAFLLEKRDSQINEDKWETIDSLYYSVDDESGIIQCMDGVFFFRTRNGYRVTYTSGFDFDNVATFLSDTAAGDVEVAVWLICQDIWQVRGFSSNIYSEAIGDYKLMFQRAVKGATGFGFENGQAAAVLDKYIDASPLGVLTPLQSIG